VATSLDILTSRGGAPTSVRAGFLLQGLLNLDSEIAVNILFVALVLGILMVVIYLRGKWLIALFVSSVRKLWFKMKYDSHLKNRF
jgi:hypothetical protein